MGKIIISENASLDGVVQDPTGEEGFRFGGWFGQVNDSDRQAWTGMGAEEAASAKALLLGRLSDEWFASRWLGRTGPWADRLNSMPKYILSSTLKEPKWPNSTVLGGDLVGEITKLKSRIDGDIVVIGSIQLVHALWAHDLIDELRLKVFPMVLGSGRRLFGEGGEMRGMRRTAVKPLGDSLSYLIYERTR
jgi:dihydrofolate reductase